MSTAPKTFHLEGSLVVEMTNGDHRVLTRTPYEGKVYHTGDDAWEVTVTPEAQFRQQIHRIVSRSRFDRR